MKDAWPEILEAVKAVKLNAWLVVLTAQTLELRNNDVLVMSFPSETDVASFKQQQAPGEGVSEHLRAAIIDVLGLRVKFVARTAGANAGANLSAEQQPPGQALSKSPAEATAPVRSLAVNGSASVATDLASAATGSASAAIGWATVAIPGSSLAAAPEPDPSFDEEPPPFDDDVRREIDRSVEEPELSAAVITTPTTATAAPAAPVAPAPKREVKTSAPAFEEKQRYGESVVREILGATFLEEQPHDSGSHPRGD